MLAPLRAHGPTVIISPVIVPFRIATRGGRGNLTATLTAKALDSQPSTWTSTESASKKYQHF
jgi:hypothetical protein